MAVLGITACTSEIPGDTPEIVKNSELSVVFAVNAPVTKASNENIPASEAEKTISDFHVAIFDNAGKRIDYKDLNIEDGSEDLTSVAYQEKAAYKVRFANLSIENSPVFAIVIANAKDYTTANFSNYTTYENYLAAGENRFAPIVQTTAFDAGKLVKFGKSDPVTLTVANSPITIPVPLTQLTLRVDFEGVSIKTKALNTRAAGQTIEYDVIGANNVSKDVLSAIKKQIGDLNGLTWNPKTGSEYDGGWLLESYYTQWETNLFDAGYYNPQQSEYQTVDWFKAERNAYYRNRVLIVTKTTKSESEGEAGYELFRPTAVSYSGINTKSDIAIFNNKSVENSQQGLSNQYVALNMDKDLSFYTFENTEALTLKIEGYYEQSSGSEGSSATTVQYGYLLQNRPNNGNWSDVDISAASIESQKNDIRWVEAPTKATKSVSIPAGAKIETYYLNLNNLQNGNLVKGNIYSVTGYYTPSHEYPVTPEIDWKVEEITTHNVTIPNDTFK